MTDDKPIHPGQLLKIHFLDPLGVTPWALAKAIGVQVGRITALIRGERTLTPDTARRLGLYFQVPAQWFLEAQARWDAALVEQDSSLVAVVTPFPRLDETIVTPRGVVLIRKVERSRPMASVMASTIQQPAPEFEGTRVVQYPNGMVALEHR